MLSNQNYDKLQSLSKQVDFGKFQEKATKIISKKLEPSFTQAQKLNALLDTDIKAFNYLVFEFLKTTDYPLASESSFALLDNEDVLVREDIFRILEESGVGVPAYYNKIAFDVNGKKGNIQEVDQDATFVSFSKKLNGFGCMSNIPNYSKKQWSMKKTVTHGGKVKAWKNLYSRNVCTKSKTSI